MKSIELYGGRPVGERSPCFLIAEIGSNHNLDIATARRLIEVAKDAGCDAVKLQSYTADGLYSVYTPRLSEMEGRSIDGESPHELIKRIQMPLGWHRPLKEYCDELGITFFSTPFDEGMVDLLEDIGVPFYKVASYEITHYPLLEKIAETGKPVILSTGNSDLQDVELAVDTLLQKGCKDYVLLHCVSQYPARHEDMNLRSIKTMREKFDCPVGLSDHTMDNLSVIAAIALGAAVIEKHITLDKRHPGPDHSFALEPNELAEMVRTARLTEEALGSGVKVVRESEEENHRLGRRSILAAHDLGAGAVLTPGSLVIKRPGLGIHPKHLTDLFGRRVNQEIRRDQWIEWGMLQAQ